METFGNKNSQKLSIKFSCNKCDYSCFRKSDFVKHLSTDKHNGNQMETFGKIINGQNPIVLISWD